MVASEEPFLLEVVYRPLVLDIMDLDLALVTILVMDMDMDMDTDMDTDMDMDLDMVLVMDLVMDTDTTPGHRPNGMEMLLLTLQMTNTQRTTDTGTLAQIHTGAREHMSRSQRQ